MVKQRPVLASNTSSTLRPFWQKIFSAQHQIDYSVCFQSDIAHQLLFKTIKINKTSSSNNRRSAKPKYIKYYSENSILKSTIEEEPVTARPRKWRNYSLGPVWYSQLIWRVVPWLDKIMEPVVYPAHQLTMAHRTDATRKDMRPLSWIKWESFCSQLKSRPIPTSALNSRINLMISGRELDSNVITHRFTR